MKKYYLIDNNNIIDECISDSVDNAKFIFSQEGWVIGEVVSEDDPSLW